MKKKIVTLVSLKWVVLLVSFFPPLLALRTYYLRLAGTR